MFWSLLLGSRLGFRWLHTGSLGFYPAVLLCTLSGPAPTSPGRHYGVDQTAFDFATSTFHCVSRRAIFASSVSYAVFCFVSVAKFQAIQTGRSKVKRICNCCFQPFSVMRCCTGKSLLRGSNINSLQLSQGPLTASHDDRAWFLPINHTRAMSCH